TALRSIDFRNTSENPSELNRIVRFVVSDGSAESAPVTREIHVSRVNDAPTISHIPDVMTDEDTAAGPIGFTISDAESAVDSLLLSVSSSNVTLLPNANIAFGGSGANRSLFLLPAPNQNGSTTITLNVADPDGATTTRSFILTVVPVNHPPVLSNIESTAMNYKEGDGAQAVSGTISVNDVDNAELAGATVRFMATYFKGEDSLEFTDMSSIHGAFDADNGVLTLSGTDT